MLAALKIKECITTIWSDIERSEDKVTIYAGAKLFGYQSQDIDVIVSCNFFNPRVFSPVREVHCRDSGDIEKKEIYIDSLLLAIEVKDHSANRVKFEGEAAFVEYTRNNSDGWHPVSDQSLNQLHSLKQFIFNEFGRYPFVGNLIYFSNLEESDLPRRPHNVISSSISPRDLFTVIAEIQKPYRKKNGKCFLSLGPRDLSNKIPDSKLFNVLVPTELDRKKIDAISLNHGFNSSWIDSVGKRFLILRGMAGTGKTIALLQIANFLFINRSSRCLLLTYNRALVSEIRRIIALLNLPAGVDDGGVKIESSSAFFWNICKKFGLLIEEDNFENIYESSLKELTKAFEENIFSDEEITATIGSSPELLAFDYVLVDESQDWFEDEIKILKRLFGIKNLVVSDGVDQLVRGKKSSWILGLKESEKILFSLDKSLRMKANLVYFANQVSMLLEYPEWSIKANQLLKGGRVIVYVGDFWSSTPIIKLIISESINLKNSLIDLLMLISHKRVNEMRDPLELNKLEKSLSATIWPGFMADIRREGSNHPNKLRILNYNSARGLEGWSVFLMDFDSFLSTKRELALNEYSGLSDPVLNQEEWLQREVARWALMIFTRPVDTLFIHIQDKNSPTYQWLKILAERMPDFIQWNEERFNE